MAECSENEKCKCSKNKPTLLIMLGLMNHPAQTDKCKISAVVALG
jgi:hypothetical protein